MKILLLAPQPFFEERGTPIAVDLLARTLAEQGHQIDLLTFAGSQDWQCDNVNVHHVKTWPNMGAIKPGFSLKKMYSDFFMFFDVLRRLFTQRYDVVHAVEESAFIALVFKPFFRYRFINDCDSSMVTQLIDKFSACKVVERPLRFIESIPSRYADAVVPMCDSLADDIRQYRQDSIFVLKDIDLSTSDTPPPISLEEDVRALFESADAPLFMYIGNLESYQGIDLLLDSMLSVVQAGHQANLVIIGGSDKDIATYHAWCEQHQLSHAVKLIGKRPIAGLAYYMAQADFLVSPRTQGTNTPMKIYSYLASNKPVLATRLLTHTQVMNDDIGYLVAPNKNAFAEAMTKMAQCPDDFQAMAKAAAQLIERDHSRTAFSKTVATLYAYISNKTADTTATPDRSQ